MCLQNFDYFNRTCNKKRDKKDTEGGSWLYPIFRTQLLTATSFMITED